MFTQWLLTAMNDFAGLEMLQQHGSQLPHAWIAGDDEMGRPYVFRRQLAELGEHYLLAVASNTLIRNLEAPAPISQRTGKEIRRPWQRVDAWASAQPDTAWSQHHVRDGSQGPLQVELLTCCVVDRTTQHQQGHEETLVVVRRFDRDQPQTVKRDYYLSFAPANMARQEFARADPLGEGQPSTWRMMLIKVAARITVNSRRVLVFLSSSWPYLTITNR